MTEPHTADNCDAFPLAVGLVQLQARIERLEAIAERMAEALQMHAEQDCTGCQNALAEYTAHLIDG